MFHFQRFDSFTQISGYFLSVSFHFYSSIDSTNNLVTFLPYYYYYYYLLFIIYFYYQSSFIYLHFDSFILFIYPFSIPILFHSIPFHSIFKMRFGTVFLTPFQHFRLGFPTSHPAFLSTYRFPPLRGSQPERIRLHSSLLATRLQDSSHPDFVSTFFHFSDSTPAPVCSISHRSSALPLFHTTRLHPPSLRSAGSTPRLSLDLCVLSTSTRTPSRFPPTVRTYFSFQRHTHSLHYVHIAIPAADRHPQDVRVL